MCPLKCGCSLAAIDLATFVSVPLYEIRPVIGRDDPDQVLAWIQDRITCHIPDKDLILNYMG